LGMLDKLAAFARAGGAWFPMPSRYAHDGQPTVTRYWHGGRSGCADSGRAVVWVVWHRTAAELQVLSRVRHAGLTRHSTGGVQASHRGASRVSDNIGTVGGGTIRRMFDGFKARRSQDGIAMRVGGDGPPLLLLHGYPQTHVMWHAVAPFLA